MADINLDIERPQTQEEKKDYISLSAGLTPIEKFKPLVEKKYVEFTTKYKPYCVRCARNDFLQMNDKKAKAMELRLGYVDFLTLKIEYPDLDQYGKEDRFQFIKDSDTMVTLPLSITGGVQRQKKIGVHRTWMCKVCGNNEHGITMGMISIDIPQEVLDEQTGKKAVSTKS